MEAETEAPSASTYIEVCTVLKWPHSLKKFQLKPREIQVRVPSPLGVEIGNPRFPNRETESLRLPVSRRACTPDPHPHPHPRFAARGSGVGVPPPICRGSGVHPHPHPRFADLPGIGSPPSPVSIEGSVPWNFHGSPVPNFTPAGPRLDSLLEPGPNLPIRPEAESPGGPGPGVPWSAAH